MISEGSCDTEDWNNDAENSALHHRNKLQFKIHNMTVFTVFFDKINAALVSIRDFQKHFFFLSYHPKLLNNSVCYI